MRFRKLRIAWSVVFGLACVLLIALCVRSYRYSDYLSRNNESGRIFGFGSNYGAIVLSRSDWSDTGVPYKSHGWEYRRGSVYELSKFHWEWDGGEGMIRIPIWLPVSLFSVAGVLPWIGPSYRRFGLRTLLIVTTLVAMGLGLIVWLR
jgi:hypothetical protein